MNLFDCRIPYTALPECVLDLTSKVSLVMALEIYRQRSVSPLEAKGGRTLTAYERRKASEIARELLRKGVILRTEEVEDGERGDGKSSPYALVPLDMRKDKALAKERLVIPTLFDYRSLSPAGIKLYVALSSLIRYSRTPFRVEMTQTELASKARLTEKSIRAALRELSEHRLVKTEKLWRKATRITLLDPESGVELFYIARFHQQRIERIPVFDRYKTLLSDYDPRDQLRHDRGPVIKHTICCPFCGGKGSTRRSFLFEADEMQGVDRWKCFKCGRSGDSARLWAKLAPWIGKGGWLTVMGEIMAENIYSGGATEQVDETNGGTGATYVEDRQGNATPGYIPVGLRPVTETKRIGNPPGWEALTNGPQTEINKEYGGGQVRLSPSDLLEPSKVGQVQYILGACELRK